MRLLKLKEVVAKTGICRSSIYSKISEGTFPKPVKLGERAVAFVSDEVDKWISQRILERDSNVSKKEGRHV